MNTRTAELELDICELEVQSDKVSTLTLEQLLLIAGGQCTTNSI